MTSLDTLKITSFEKQRTVVASTVEMDINELQVVAIDFLAMRFLS